VSNVLAWHVLAWQDNVVGFEIRSKSYQTGVSYISS